MAGWRVGLMAGAPEYVDQVLRFKSNMDSGMFLPVQLAAAKALELGKDWYDELNKTYSERRQFVYLILKAINCSFNVEQAGLFLWAKIPPGYKDGYELTDEILYGKNVFITPGGIFGSEGNFFIRVSLCQKVQALQQALDRIAQS